MYNTWVYTGVGEVSHPVKEGRNAVYPKLFGVIIIIFVGVYCMWRYCLANNNVTYSIHQQRYK